MANVDISCVEGVFLHVDDVSYFVDLLDVASVVYYVAAVDNVELRIACDLRYMDFVDLHFVVDLHFYDVHEGERSHELVLDEHI